MIIIYNNTDIIYNKLIIHAFIYTGLLEVMVPGKPAMELSKDKLCSYSPVTFSAIFVFLVVVF